MKKYLLIILLNILITLFIITPDANVKSQEDFLISNIWQQIIFAGFIFLLIWIYLKQEIINKKHNIFIFIKYSFLATLLLITLNSVLANMEFAKEFYSQYFFWLDLVKNHLVILAILTGATTFLVNRDEIEKKIEEEIEKEKINEEKTEEKRYLEFPKKFLRINKIPVLKNIVRWTYKEGWLYGCSVIGLILTGFTVRLYHLGKLGLWWDELITGTYVTRILEVGVPLFPSEFGYYWRGVAYHYFVSIFAFIFGNTEFWLRFPSVLFGMGILILIFYYAKKIDKITALFILFFLVFSTYNIEYSRFARFYIMNVFLFILAIPIFYKGFFENELKHKFLSAGIFFIMLHTVQTGSIFLSLIGAWGLFFVKDLFFYTKQKMLLIKDNVNNFLFIFLFLFIFYLDNIFYKLIKIIPPYQTSLDLGLAVKPRSWNYFSIPKFELFNFFNENYISLGFIIISFLFIAFLFILNKQKQIKFFTFSSLSLFIAIMMYEIGSRGLGGARIFLFAEALLIMTTFLSLYLILRIYFKKKITYILLGVITILLMLNIQPYFFDRININYGDGISKDPFRTTNVAAYRADYKTTYEYLKKHKQNNDLWINVMGNNYFNYNSVPDYIFNQNIRWNTGALVDKNGNFISYRNKALLINSLEDIIKIINENKNKKIWLLVNGGSVNILGTTHIRADFKKFLKENEEKVIYKSPDNWSKILLFN